LAESRHLAESAGVPFEGGDLLREYLTESEPRLVGLLREESASGGAADPQEFGMIERMASYTQAIGRPKGEERIMATVSSEKRTIEVRLLRTGQDLRTYTLPEGATLADLMREADTTYRSSNLLVDGRYLESAIVLKSGMLITIMPEPAGTPGIRSWRDTVGMFADDPDFEEMVEAGRSIREADRQAARKEAAREEGAREDS
jgi:hypothetical protein